MRRALVLLGALLLCVGLARCFKPELADCAYLCGPECPEGYLCQEDGYCHLTGSTAQCPPLPDLRPPARDLSVEDGGGDLGAADMAVDLMVDLMADLASSG